MSSHMYFGSILEASDERLWRDCARADANNSCAETGCDCERPTDDDEDATDEDDEDATDDEEGAACRRRAFIFASHTAPAIWRREKRKCAASASTSESLSLTDSADRHSSQSARRSSKSGGAKVTVIILSAGWLSADSGCAPARTLKPSNSPSASSRD